MATIAILIGGAIANAVAFVGGNAIYDKFGRTDGSEERIRHDRAIKDLQRATSDWNQKRLETLDFINNKLREKSESRNTFDDVDRALDFYNETHPDANLQLVAQPVLSNFYKPTNEQKYYEIVVITFVIALLVTLLINVKNKTKTPILVWLVRCTSQMNTAAAIACL